jgi:hypothetical protein
MNTAKDEIIKEVQAIREACGERFDFDIEALYRDAKARETKSERKVVSLEPRLLPKVTSCREP